MKQANVAIIKNRLSEYLRYVKKGETVRVYERAMPIADIVPVSSLTRKDRGARLVELEAKGVIRRGREPLPASFFKGLRPAAGQPPAGVLDQLLEDRKKKR